METGLAANLEIFSNGESIFSHSADFQECDPNASAEELVNKLYDDGIMSKIDALQEEGGDLSFKVSLYTSDGDVMVDGIAYETMPESTEQFSTDLYFGLSGLHEQLEQQYMISGDCTHASNVHDVQSGSAIKPM